MSQDANYRKHNDGSLNSSTYHKKDGTNVRAKMKEELLEEENEAASKATVGAGVREVFAQAAYDSMDRENFATIDRMVDGAAILAQLAERTEDELPIPDAPEWKPDYSVTPRRVVCAANRNRESGRIICGARHWDKVMRAQKLPDEGWDGWDQGFIDQFGDFITRTEAWDIAKERGQIWREVSSPGTLFSENLY